MFCPEGYITLHEVFETLIRESWTNTPRSTELERERSQLIAEQVNGIPGFDEYDFLPPRDEMDAYVRWNMKLFFEIYADEIRVSLPSGGTARVSRQILAPTHSIVDSEDWSEFGIFPSFPDQRPSRLHLWGDEPVDLEYIEFNEIRNVDYPAFTINCTKENDSATEIGLRLINGCPLCVKEHIVSSVLNLSADLENKLRDRLLGSDPPFAAKGHPLVDQIIQLMETGKFTRDQAKARLGRGIKAAEWRSCWQQASTERPDLRMSVPGPRGAKRS